MVGLNCINCNKEINVGNYDTKREDIEYCTFDCPHCGITMTMEQGELKDFNKVLEEAFSEFIK